MENATKALLIAAGVFLAIMILAMLVMFGGEVASYFSEKHEATVLQQLVEFNNKFVNYNGQTIRGNELISVMNRVIDYNNYQSEMVGYERIIITVDLKGHENEFKYRNESSSNLLFSGDISNIGNDYEIKRVSELSGNLTSGAVAGIPGLTEAKLQQMSSRIEYIVDDAEALDKQAYEIERNQILTKILRYNPDEKGVDIDDIKQATYLYYQLTKFKSAMFDCTNVLFNEENGRVNRMTFEVVEENGSIKFE